VAFVDFAPTLLSLAGIEIPDYMTGRAFLGPFREEPQQPFIFLYGDRFDESYKFNRGLTDGEYRYIRNFLPHQSAALKIAYPFRMKAWNAFRDAHARGLTTPEQGQVWLPVQPPEELFHTDSDPWELENLADKPEYEERLIRMREKLIDQMVANRDTGFIPEAMFPRLAPHRSIHHFARTEAYQCAEVIQLAFKASDRDPAHRKALVEALESEDPLLRYWGIMGLLMLPHGVAINLDSVESLLRREDHVSIQIRAAELLVSRTAGDRGLDFLVGLLPELSSDAALTLALNVVADLDAVDAIPRDWLRHLAEYPAGYPYSARLAQAFLDLE
jgi:hypothetical protein